MTLPSKPTPGDLHAERLSVTPTETTHIFAYRREPYLYSIEMIVRAADLRRVPRGFGALQNVLCEQSTVRATSGGGEMRKALSFAAAASVYFNADPQIAPKPGARLKVTIEELPSEVDDK